MGLIHKMNHTDICIPRSVRHVNRIIMAKSKTLDPGAPGHIKNWRTSARLSRLALSQSLGVSKTTVSNWELGFNEPGATTYRKIAELALPPDKEWFLRKSGSSDKEIEVLAGTGAPSTDRGNECVDIKVYKSAGAGAFRSVEETPDHTVPFPRAWLPTTQKLVGLVVEGDSMSPLIETGFIVIVDRTKKTAASALNHIVAASDGTGVTIKHMVERDDGYWLTPHNMNIENRPTPVGPSTRIIGVVVKWIGQPLPARK